ncbi:MAG TPA: hydroxymethylbilane synthase [Candidatus Limnocylindria bacterium]|nr:hydroxymethylbilane synthase [Candidatus Limnocylindria bacterium]
MRLRIATRGSALALAQARLVADLLGGADLLIVRTAGDASDRPIRELADGAFVTAVEDAVRRGDADAAVHSMKDLPTGERPGLAIAAVPRREDPRDVIVVADRRGLAGLPRGADVGTSSPRRAAAIRALRPDVTVREIRGNVDTRLRRVASGEYGGAVLALAGLRRLGVAVGDDEVLGTDVALPAPGQGALGVQCRAADRATQERLSALDDDASRRAVEAERELLRLLGASCELALGALATVDGGAIRLEASLDGARVVVRGATPGAAARAAADALGALTRA